MYSVDKKIEYLQRIKERQREKYFSEESINKRREKAIQYQKNLKEKKYKLKKFSDKIISLHEKDTKFYEQIWQERKHYCENCGKFLGNNFRESNGNLISYRYAHIIPKAVYPYLRHYKDNILLLCLDCHTKLDTCPLSIIEKMNCYNQQHIEELKSLHKNLEKENNTIYK